MNEIPHPDLEDQKAGDGDKRPSDFVDDLTFGQKLRMSWRGQNEFGRIGGVVLDIAELLLPKYVSHIRTILQKTTKTMDKPILKSKSVWAGILLAATAILQSLGVDWAGDPLVMENIYHALYGLAGLLGIYGLRRAVGELISEQKK